MTTAAIKQRLERWLRETMGLRRRGPPAVVEDPEQPFFWMGEKADPVSITVDRHHEMQADVFVVDPGLGSIGVVHCISTEPLDVSTAVSDWIEGAAYLRHLMGMRVDELRATGASQGLPSFVPSVELVLVVDSAAKEALGGLQKTLREFKAKSTLLHAIGINMAVIAEVGKEADDSGLQRGFAWLLKETRAWLNSQSGAASEGSQPRERKAAAEWETLEATDFRVGGTRIWRRFRRSSKPAGGATPLLHVLHGPNGSGKSSLAEAFEFAVYERSTRLRTADLSPLIHRSADRNEGPTKAEVKLLDGKGNVIIPRTVSCSTEGARSGEADSGAFGVAMRFDEEVCDRLIRKDHTQRMAYWLSTYFPDERENWRKGRGARSTLKNALLGLGIEESSEAGIAFRDQVKSRLIGVAGQEFWNGAMVALGLPAEWRRVAGDADRELLAANPADDAAAKELHIRLLTVGARMVTRAARWLGPEFESYLRGLGKTTFRDSPESVVSVDEYERNYRAWLENVARTELLRSAWRIRRTFVDWAPPKTDFLSRLRVPVDLEEIDAAVRAASGERDKLRQWLSSHSRPGAGKARGSREVSADLATADVEPLAKAMEAGLFEGLHPAGAASKLRLAFERRRAEEIHGLLVGRESGWTQPLLNRWSDLVAMRDWMVARGWRQGSDPEMWARQLVGHMEATAGAVKELGGLDQKSADRLLELAPRLPAALMELVELLTPASWAYQRLEVRMNLPEEDPNAASFGLQSRGMELADVLNTAELNTVALAMHLLCAPLAVNQYKVLFLDDPLQNMDELTVTTVARALAKLFRLMGQTGHGELDFVLLLHAADDCERISRRCLPPSTGFPGVLRRGPRSKRAAQVRSWRLSRTVRWALWTGRCSTSSSSWGWGRNDARTGSCNRRWRRCRRSCAVSLVQPAGECRVSFASHPNACPLRTSGPSVVPQPQLVG